MSKLPVARVARLSWWRRLALWFRPLRRRPPSFFVVPMPPWLPGPPTVRIALDDTSKVAPVKLPIPGDGVPVWR